MIPTLYKRNVATHYKLVAAALAVYSMYLLVILNMYDPANANLLQQLAGMKLSENMMAAFGFTAPPPGLVGFLSAYLYGFLLPALPLVPLLVMANRLIAAQVDTGAMALILSTPHTRRRVAGTQAVFLLSVMVVQVLWITALGLLAAQAQFPGLLDTSSFLWLNFGLLLTHLMVSGIAFFASCLFSDSRRSLTLGAGLPALFLILHMLHNASPGSHWLTWLTAFSLSDASALARGNPHWAQLAAMFVAGLSLYVGGIYVFDRKDLPL